MRHRPIHTAAGLVLVAALAGCTPVPGEDPRITQWREGRQADVATDRDVVAVLSLNVAADDDGGRVDVTLERPALPTAITFDCLGEGVIDLEIGSLSTAGGPATRTTTTLDAIDCADGPHEIDPASLGEKPISSVNATASNADNDTAWFLTVRGDRDPS
ncbi:MULTISPECIES: hypothetical protein [unclassified Rathayibacter]|uniref:hypothetical protein n=1 Tax=unclassified Rathayibacter TaxID=2609250 RepID=UPI0011B0153C|nr:MULTISPECIES: hypothetical protein [unclassified Rathayibacter]